MVLELDSQPAIGSRAPMPAAPMPQHELPHESREQPPLCSSLTALGHDSARVPAHGRIARSPVGRVETAGCHCYRQEANGDGSVRGGFAYLLTSIPRSPDRARSASQARPRCSIRAAHAKESSQARARIRQCCLPLRSGFPAYMHSRCLLALALWPSGRQRAVARSARPYMGPDQRAPLPNAAPGAAHASRDPYERSPALPRLLLPPTANPSWALISLTDW